MTLHGFPSLFYFFMPLQGPFHAPRLRAPAAGGPAAQLLASLPGRPARRPAAGRAVHRGAQRAAHAPRGLGGARRALHLRRAAADPRGVAQVALRDAALWPAHEGALLPGGLKRAGEGGEGGANGLGHQHLKVNILINMMFYKASYAFSSLFRCVLHAFRWPSLRFWAAPRHRRPEKLGARKGSSRLGGRLAAGRPAAAARRGVP